MDPLGFEDFCVQVRLRQVEVPTERFGQAAFNTLHNIRPDLSERVRGTNLDPFHNDAALADFYAFAQENWNGW